MSIEEKGARRLECSCGGACDAPADAYGPEMMRLWAAFREVHAACSDEGDGVTERRGWDFHKAADAARAVVDEARCGRRRGGAV